MFQNSIITARLKNLNNAHNFSTCVNYLIDAYRALWERGRKINSFRHIPSKNRAYT